MLNLLHIHNISKCRLVTGIDYLYSATKHISKSIPAIVDLPTPPFAEDTATTLFTSLIFLFSGNPFFRGNEGGVPDLGKP